MLREDLMKSRQAERLAKQKLVEVTTAPDVFSVSIRASWHVMRADSVMRAQGCCRQLQGFRRRKKEISLLSLFISFKQCKFIAIFQSTHYTVCRSLARPSNA